MTTPLQNLVFADVVVAPEFAHLARFDLFAETEHRVMRQLEHYRAERRWYGPARLQWWAEQWVTSADPDARLRRVEWAPGDPLDGVHRLHCRAAAPAE